jgi:uncharacterized damage-inducible protein DinB
MLPDKARSYLLHGLSATPLVIDRLLKDATEAEFDRRPDPDRFTIREAMAHLADWEGVWMERISKMATEENPHLQGYDEGQWAIDNDYAHLDVHEQQARFREGRARLLAYLRDLPSDQWQRSGLHTEVGPVTIASLAVLVLGHDGYHTKQISEWLASGS